MSTEIKVEEDVLSLNRKNASDNRDYFARLGVYVLNLMSGPGAGKTTLLERTAEVMGKRLRMAVRKTKGRNPTPWTVPLSSIRRPESGPS